MAAGLEAVARLATVARLAAVVRRGVSGAGARAAAGPAGRARGVCGPCRGPARRAAGDGGHARGDRPGRRAGAAGRAVRGRALPARAGLRPGGPGAAERAAVRDRPGRARGVSALCVSARRPAAGGRRRASARAAPAGPGAGGGVCGLRRALGPGRGGRLPGGLPRGGLGAAQYAAHERRKRRGERRHGPSRQPLPRRDGTALRDAGPRATGDGLPAGLHGRGLPRRRVGARGRRGDLPAHGGELAALGRVGGLDSRPLPLALLRHELQHRPARLAGAAPHGHPSPGRDGAGVFALLLHGEPLEPPARGGAPLQLPLL